MSQDFVGPTESRVEETGDEEIIYQRDEYSDQSACHQDGSGWEDDGTDPPRPSASIHSSPLLQLNPDLSAHDEQSGTTPDQFDVLEVDEMEQLINNAIKSVQDMSFDSTRSATFTSAASALLSKADTTEIRRFCGLVCARLHKLFIQERSTQVVHGIRFFYTALLLSREDAVWINQEENEVLLLVDVQHIEQFLWSKVYSKTQFTPYKYQEILQLLNELQGKVLTVSNQTTCAGVCYHMASTLFTAFLRMRMRGKVFKDNVKHLLLTMVKCAISKDRHDCVEDLVRLVAEEYFEMENSEACELWSRCCQQRGDLRRAQDLAESAISIARREDKSRLEDYLFSLHMDLARKEKKNSEADMNWVRASGVNHNIDAWQKTRNQKTNTEEGEKKSKKKEKTIAVPKTRESAQPVFYERTSRRRRHTATGACSVSGISALQDLTSVEPKYRPVPVRPPNEEAMIEVDLWAEDQSESESEGDYEFEPEDTGDEDDEEQDQGPEESPEPPSKSWFEESQELYNSGQEGEQLIVGEGLDIDYFPSDTFQNPPRYTPLRPPHELDHLLYTEPDKYKRCRIELEGPHRATCRVTEAGQSTQVIEIHGRRKCGQTFNNDDVLVEILKNDSTKAEDSEKVFGQVVGVYHSPFKEEEYRLLACTSNPKEGHVMHPMCKSVPKMYIWKGSTKEHHKHHQYRIDIYKIDKKRKLKFAEYFDIQPNKRGQYVFLVVYLTWGPQFTYPRGAVLKVLDCGNTFGSGLTVLLHQFNVPTYYSKETVVHTEKLLEKQEKKPQEGYTDLGDEEVFTIDPPQSKDLDDALSIWKKGDNFVVGVHIADVAAVVKKDDALDKEALKRATSFYTSSDWRNHNMLPEPLSQNKLSLLPGLQRYVLSIFFVVDETGQDVKEPTVKKCLIKSCRKFSYQEAQEIIDGKGEDNCSESLKNKVQQLNILARQMRTRRLKNSRFYVEYFDPRLSESEENTEAEEAHALIEEFMVKANHFIATWLMERNRKVVPLRCQNAPVEEELNQWLENEGHVLDMMVRLQNKLIQEREIDATQHDGLNLGERTKYLPVQRNTWKQILNACQIGNVTAVQKLLCCDNLHPLQCIAGSHWLTILNSAEYKCSGEGTGSDLHHFMLELHPYTHFTSPIRRYIDLVIQRLVHAALDDKPCPYSFEEIREICHHVTKASRNQRRFGKCCKAIKQAEKLVDKPLMFDAVVDTVSDSGVTVCIPSLKGMTKRSGEVAFNLLDFSSKPVEKITLNKTEVFGYWNKRVYTFETLKKRQVKKKQEIEARQARQAGRSRETREDREAREARETRMAGLVKLSSDMHIVNVQVRDFCKVLKAVFENGDVQSIARNLSPDGEFCYLSHTSGEQVVRKVTSDECGDNDIKHHCKFSLSFSPGQILRVQMHAQADQGVLSPYVQLFQVCDDLHLCLGHIHDPVNTFAKYVTKGIRESRFGTARQYRDSWRPIVDMETAVSSVSNEETIIVKDVKVTLHKERKTVLGFFSFDVAFCESRRIMIDGKNIDRLSTMSVKETPFEKRSRERSLDYLCIRYTPDKFNLNVLRSSSVWIGHAVITKVRLQTKNVGPMVVTFQLTPNSQQPPQSLLNASFTTMVEIILKTEVDRKSETMLAKLKDSSELEDNEEEDLATYIALTRPVPFLGERRLQLSRASPDDVPIEEQLEVVSGYMPPNNPSQREAIGKALISRFSLIQGPPGTGKTYTGIKLVYLFTKINKKMQEKGFDIEQKQVLFCGPSNKSVDLVAKYLMQRLGSKLKIVRMYGKAIENMDFPVPKRDIVSKRSLRGLASDPDLKGVTLHHMIRQKGMPFATKIKELDEKFEKFFQNEPVTITQDDLKIYTRLVNKAQNQELKIADVILCTCTVGGNSKLLKLSEVKNKSKIAQCIIDESAMCPEPQSMIPIIANKPEQVVLIGDHKQLRPIVQCTQAAELGLDQSLFERYKEGRAFLNTQYRMHPSICKFPSEEFYDGNLQTGPTRVQDAKWYIKPGEELSIWSVKHIPILAPRFENSSNPKVFCHVTGSEETLTVNTEDGNEQSKSNMMEVEKVVEVFLYLVKQCSVPPQKINLMTQYNAQRSAIRAQLKTYGIFDEITTQTVVASQGGEWDYVVFSAVRSLPEFKIERNPTPGWLKHNLGFITDQNQINVALTRARKGLVIIGNGHLLQCDPVWRKLITTYRAEGCYRRSDQFPPPLKNSGRFRGFLQRFNRT